MPEQGSEQGIVALQALRRHCVAGLGQNVHLQAIEVPAVAFLDIAM